MSMEYMPEGLRMNAPENRAAYANLSAIRESCERQRILEARALVCDASHNLLVDLGGIKGMIPRIEGALGIEEGYTRDIAILSRVNKPVCFKILSLTEDSAGAPMAVLSRRAVQQECMERYISQLSPGDVIPAKVTHMEPFGAFVDIGCGISSLIPIDSISVSRIAHPSDRFSIGQAIRAVAKSMDTVTSRICLTHKELLGSWEENASLFSVGETVAGIVRSVEPYGVFVELAPNLAGLAEVADNVHNGQQASVYIKSLLPEKMKVKLIIINAFDASYDLRPFHYFYAGRHLDRWRYSPTGSDKLIETVFAGEAT